MIGESVFIVHTNYMFGDAYIDIFSTYDKAVDFMWNTLDEDVYDDLDDKPFLPIVYNDDKGSPRYHQHSILWLSAEGNASIAYAHATNCEFIYSIN